MASKAMHCPTLTELPPPPAGKIGWPWTEETPQLTDIIPDPSTGSDQVVSWPRISIVTPSYNQGQFIEETIRSVLLQSYPNLEYIIIDGGSKDDSLNIISKYENWLAYWEAESDRGQSHAINKGFARCNGNIIAWLNSDDIYLKGTLKKIVRVFQHHRDIHLVYGNALFVDENSVELRPYKGHQTSLLGKLEYWKGWHIPQPTVFFKRDLYLQIGELDESLHYALDYEFFLRAAFQHRFRYVPDKLASYRRHGASKTGDWYTNKKRFHEECHRAVNRHIKPTMMLYWRWKISYVFSMLLKRRYIMSKTIKMASKLIAVISRLGGICSRI
jgi:glycosyltransferase involved in cell wall biosynthesis